MTAATTTADPISPDLRAYLTEYALREVAERIAKDEGGERDE